MQIVAQRADESARPAWVGRRHWYIYQRSSFGVVEEAEVGDRG